MNASARGVWASRIGFILAATGSAIGLGNIWKFPYITGVYGGGAFVLVYLLCVLVIGLPLMYAEIAIGRQGQSDPIGALTGLAQGPRARAFGWITGFLGVFSGVVILSFYSVVAGWAIHFLFQSIQGYPGGPDAIGGVLDNLASAEGGKLLNASLLWHTAFMTMTVGIVTFGIQKGIEVACKVLMPTLVLLLVALMVIGLRMEGGPVAIDFMFAPDFSSLTGDAILEAMGHAFFTLSLGMGAMITYGSYLKKQGNVVADAITISILDTVIALVAGLAIFSVTFTYCLEPGAGPALLFATLPVQFAQMAGGQAFGIAFFALVVFAALTSGISLLEVVTAFAVDRLGMRRKVAALSLGLGIYLLGIASVFSVGGVLDFLDNLTTRYTLPIGGFLIALFAGFCMAPSDSSAGMGSAERPLYKAWRVTIRFVTPVLVAIVIANKLGLLSFTAAGDDTKPVYPQTATCEAKQGESAE